MLQPDMIKRSADYRYQYIKKHPGFLGLYMCAYCGKIIKKDKMEVDHVISVDLAAHSRLYRLLLFGKNVNDTNNLVASCHACNRKKTNHGGLWIIRGKTGVFAQPILWLLFIVFLYYYTQFFWMFF